MKRLGNIWDKIVNYDNIALALRKAAKGRANNRTVRPILKNKDYYIRKILYILTTGSYYTSRYKSRVIYEPKQRTIYILPFFPDRIVQHAILNVLGDYWDKKFIYNSFSCRVGKGQHKGSKTCATYVRKYKYALKCDISKFYPSLDHEIIKGIFKKKIKDTRVLNLLFEIVNSADSCKETANGKNAPIGNLLSQWIGNLYLNEFDTYVKHVLKVKAYLRYCDDFIFFSNSKKDLNEILIKSRTYLKDNLKLTLSKNDLFPVSRGVDFLGYRHFPKFILVRKSTAKRIKKRLKNISKSLDKDICTDKMIGQLASAKGWLSKANTYNFRKSTNFEELYALGRQKVGLA